MPTPAERPQEFQSKRGDRFSFEPNDPSSVTIVPRGETQSFRPDPAAMQQFLSESRAMGPDDVSVPARLREFAASESLRELAFEFTKGEPGYVSELGESLLSEIREVSGGGQNRRAKGILSAFTDRRGDLSDSEVRLIMFEAEIAKDLLVRKDDYMSAAALRELFDAAKGVLRRRQT